MTWYVYMAVGSSGAIYTGTSTDVTRRMKEHNEEPHACSISWHKHKVYKGAKWAHKERPLVLLCSILAANRSEALWAEARIKHALSHDEKVELAAFVQRHQGAHIADLYDWGKL